MAVNHKVGGSTPPSSVIFLKNIPTLINFIMHRNRLISAKVELNQSRSNDDVEVTTLGGKVC